VRWRRRCGRCWKRSDRKQTYLVDSLAVEAAFTMAFTCFLRMDEITYDRFDPTFNLLRSSIVIAGKEQASLVTFRPPKPIRREKG